MLAICINGQNLIIDTNTNLQQAITSYVQKMPDTDLTNVALVVNQNIIPKSLWLNHVCQNHDQIEIFSAVAGG